MWKSLGPKEIHGRYYGTVAGRINSIVLNGSAVVIAAANGGIWRGVPDPKNSILLDWSAVGNDLPSLSFGAIDHMGSTFFAASGEGNYYCSDCSPGDKIFDSSDGGATWRIFANSPVRYATALRISPQDGTTLWVAGAKDMHARSTGVFEATNVSSGTAKFQPVALGNDSDHPTDIVLDPRDPGRVFVADAKGILARDPSTHTWSRVLTILPSDDSEARNGVRYAGKIAIAPAASPNDPNIVYASFAYASFDTDYFKGGSLKGIFKSVQGGQSGTWTPLPNVPDYFVNAPGQAGQGTYDQALAVDPRHPERIYAGGIKLIYSLNGGNTWYNAPDNLHPDHHAITVDDHGLVYIGNDGGLFKLTPTTGRVDQLSAGLAITEFYQGGSVGPDDSVLLAGSQDNGSEQIPLSQPSSFAWRAVEEGDGAYTAIEPRNGKGEYIEIPHGTIESTDDAQRSPVNWKQLPVKISDSLFYMPFVVAPNDWNTIYAGADGIYKTTNAGAKWQELTAGNVAWVSKPLVVALAVSGNGKTIVAARNDESVAVSGDGGASWTSRIVGGDPIRAVKLFGDEAYVASRFQDAGYSVIYAIGNLSGTPVWRTVTQRAPLVNVISDYEGKRLLGTDNGVYELHANGSVEDCAFAAGMPQLPVRDLLETPHRTLIALTHGRGAWALRR